MMQAAGQFDPYPRTHKGASPLKHPPAKDEETDQIAASFLLSLKHSRSVTPDPQQQRDDSDPSPTRRDPYKSYSSHVSFTYECAYPEQRQPAQTDEEYAVPPSLTAESSRASSVDTTYEMPQLHSMMGESKLVLMKDKDLVPDALFIAMAQMQPCRLTHADRVGCYKSREIGFLGMCCKHCGGQPGFGRYYPNSVRSLAQTTTSQTILKHIGSKCRFCPSEIRKAVLRLQEQTGPAEGVSTGRPRYGSRKIFFQRVWARLHKGETHKSETHEDASDDLSTQTPSDVDETSSEDENSPPSSKRKAGSFGASPPPFKNKRVKTTVV